MNFTVKQARTLNGLTQDEMAEKLDIHVQTYRKIENNPYSASIQQGMGIAKITGLEFNQIFFGIDSTLSRNGQAG